MFVRSVRLPRKRLIAICGGVLAVLMIVLTLVRTKAVPTNAAVSLDGATNEARLSFLRAYGWEAEEEPAEIVEVLIPSDFNETYTKYNELQRQQGFDLWGYAGKRVKRFGYRLTNYPNYVGEVRANLLIYSGKVVGGDISAIEKGGFLHEFDLKTENIIKNEK